MNMKKNFNLSLYMVRKVLSSMTLSCRPLLIAAGLSCMTSCVNEENVAQESPAIESYGKFVLTLPSNIVTSFSDIEGDAQVEDLMSQANLFVFKNNMLEKKLLDITNLTNSAGKPEISVLLSGRGERNLYLIANTRSSVLDGLVEGVDTEQEFCSLITDPLTGMASSPFIMSGEKLDVDLIPGRVVSVELAVERLVSRFNVMTEEYGLEIESASFVGTLAQTTYFRTTPGMRIPVIATEDVSVSGQGSVVLYSYSLESASVPLAVKLKGKLQKKEFECIFELKDEQGMPIRFNRNSIYTIRIAGDENTEISPKATTHLPKLWAPSVDVLTLELFDSETKTVLCNSRQNVILFD